MNDFPITEFDPISENYIKAENKSNITLPANCIISFFGDAVKKIVNEYKLECITTLTFESFEIPVYIYDNSLIIIHALGSGPYSAGLIEKLVTYGCNNFIVCGGCGVLTDGSTLGTIYIPEIALRDEGTSYHYVKPSRDIRMQENVFKALTSFLDRKGITYKVVKTWTTDAIYRETERKIKKRINEGCTVVDMECASFYAVAKYKNVKLGTIFYAGDDLSGLKWDSRNWKQAVDIRSDLLLLCVEYMKSFDNLQQSV